MRKGEGRWREGGWRGRVEEVGGGWRRLKEDGGGWMRVSGCFGAADPSDTTTGPGGWMRVEEAEGEGGYGKKEDERK